MMYEVSGGNKQKRDVVNKAMSYVIHLLKIPSNVYIEIDFVRSGNHTVMNIGGSRYLIEINTTVSLAEIAYTVFHEMKHIEQLASGRLRHQGFITFWEGKDMPLIEYHQRPWEIEAYNFEKSADLMLTSIAA